MATAAQIAANQANSQHSTGPTSPEGKARSSRNSFKHGLYSKDLVVPGENPAELDQLRASFRAEHQPANTTEEVLVNDLAENFWRLRRMREREAHAMQPENIASWLELGLLTLVQRTMASAERGFHRALTALRRLQKDRGFVPQNSASAEDQIGFVPENSNAPEDQIGFVSEKQQHQPDLKASLEEELRPFRDESGSLTREGFDAFRAHIRERALSQLKDVPEAA